MDEVVWEPTWRVTGAPNVGDFIQVEAYFLFYGGPIERMQGMVIKVNGKQVTLSPFISDDWFAIRWRKGFPPEVNSVIRKAKVPVDA